MSAEFVTDSLILQMGDAVRRSRLRAHLTQDDLADQVGATREWIGRLERGRSSRLEFDKVFRAMFVLGFEVHAPDGTDVSDESLEESPAGRRVSTRARRQLMAEMEKGQQVAGHQPSAEALERAERVLDGKMSFDEARREIVARYGR